MKSLAVTRIITSRDVSLAQVSEIARRTGMEMEYFIHGDMYSVQSGLCLMSGLVFGQSSNRGRCLKPCRWPWRIVSDQGGAISGTPARSDAFSHGASSVASSEALSGASGLVHFDFVAPEHSKNESIESGPVSLPDVKKYDRK